MDPTEDPTRSAGERDASPVAAGDGSLPRADELADEHDEDGWDSARHGTFAEHAQPDDAVPTVPADEYLSGGAR